MTSTNVVLKHTYLSTNLMENHPQWGASCPTDLHKENLNRTVLDDEQEYNVKSLGIYKPTIVEDKVAFV